MSAQDPQVSCVLAVHRDDGFLREAMQSILSQQEVRFELIVVANNCTDSLWSFLQEWQDPRLRTFRTSIGQLPFNLNYGVDQARAPLIARMDADDVAHPRRLITQWQAFQKNAQLDVLGTAYQSIDGQGQALGHYHPPTDNDGIRRRMRWENAIAHPTVMFKKSVLMAARGYAYGLHAEDYDLWLRLRRNPAVVFQNLPDVLLSYRIHEGQATSPVHSSREFIDLLPLYLREFWATGDPVFLLGFARKWFLSSKIWAALRPWKKRLHESRG